MNDDRTRTDTRKSQNTSAESIDLEKFDDLDDVAQALGYKDASQLGTGQRGNLKRGLQNGDTLYPGENPIFGTLTRRGPGGGDDR